jgi:hypothetical protein
MLHTFKMFWDTMGCTERHKDFSEGVKEDMGDMGEIMGHHGRGQVHNGEKGNGLGHVGEVEGNFGLMGGISEECPGVPGGGDVHGRHGELQGHARVHGGVHGCPGGVQAYAGVSGGVHGQQGVVQGHTGKL